MVGEKLKNIIYKQLNKDLGHVEIIPFNESIFFIDRENKYWYFELTKTGLLWWRYEYFTSFFSIFSLEKEEFEKILACWVEEIMNCMVNLVLHKSWNPVDTVEEVLNCKVSTTFPSMTDYLHYVEEVLNCKVSTTRGRIVQQLMYVEEVLNCKVSTTYRGSIEHRRCVEEVLNCKVSTTTQSHLANYQFVEEVLKYNISSTKGHVHDFVQEIMVEEALNYKAPNTDKVSTK